MSALSVSNIEALLAEFTPPYLPANLATAKAIKKIEINDGKVTIKLQFGFPIDGVATDIRDSIIAKVSTLAAVNAVEVICDWKIAAHAVAPNKKSLPKIKNIIAIASGKGGVGKSTTTVNLALALAQAGANVGILDADIYGPNQPHMLGADKEPLKPKQKEFIPVRRHGIQSMSIGYLIDTTTPMVWRGPMVSGALQQLLFDTLWDDLDYLFIDLPPGTGDIQLTLAQKVPVSGAVIVTTPQDISLLDARKGLEMFNKVNVPVLGIVENMSMHVCTACGHTEALFGQGGGQQIASACEVPLLGQLPLAMQIREDADRGEPTVVADAKGEVAQTYREVALRLAAHLSLQPINYAVKFPEIVVES